MENMVKLDENKQYDHQKTKRLLEEVRDFFQRKLKIIVFECVSPKDTASENNVNDAAAIFCIEKDKEPIYAACNGCGDLDRILGSFETELNDLLNNMDDLLDNNKDLDDEIKDSLESYANAIDKCINIYGRQKKKQAAKLIEMSTIDELREGICQLFSEIISKYIIMVLIDALYERINNGAGQVYELAAKEINAYLAKLGVYTKNVTKGEKIDPEYMEPTADSAENFTEDFNKFDTIDEIRRFPYYFSDDSKIIDGQARIWRRKD